MRSARIVRLVCFEIFATDAYADERRFAPPTPLPPGQADLPLQNRGEGTGNLCFRYRCAVVSAQLSNRHAAIGRCDRTAGRLDG